MDILACFKLVPELDMMTEQDWVVGAGFRVDTSFVKTVLNSYDESALELVLKLKDAALRKNAAITLTALTIDSDHANKALKNLLALKFDQVARVACEADLRFAAAGVAGIIAGYIRTIRNHQVIVMGNQSADGYNAKTPALVAEALGIPCITGVTGIDMSWQEDCLDVTAQLEDVGIEQTIRPPAVLVVGNVPNAFLRVPTLKDKLQYAKKAIKVYSLSDIGMSAGPADESDLELIDLFYEKQEKSCVFLPGDQPGGAAGLLLENYLKERVRR